MGVGGISAVAVSGGVAVVDAGKVGVAVAGGSTVSVSVAGGSREGVALAVISMCVPGNLHEDNSRHNTAAMEPNCNLIFIVRLLN
jgi:O-acetylhomoserine/O-acetylserine sulfhydrylase-like pyridoxal-dependent enzyme